MPLVNPLRVIDMMARNVIIPSDPKRIISLVPSISETLYELELDEKVVGITKFCIHPEEWFRSKKKVGGTKSLHFDIIDSLKPDLIIANSEENNKDDIEALAAKYPVWVSDISDFDEGLHAIELLGEICKAEKKAKKIIYRIHEAWSEFDAIDHTPYSCLYFIWNEPMMCAGSKTYIGDMIQKLGMKNCIEHERYPVLRNEDVGKLYPSLVFLSSEPFPFADRHIEKYQKLFPKAKIVLVDGEIFSWYGSRMRNAPKYFQKLISSIDNN